MIALTDFVYKLSYYEEVGRRIFAKDLFSEDIASSFLFFLLRGSLTFVLDITQFVRTAQNGINHFLLQGVMSGIQNVFFWRGEGDPGNSQT